MDCIRCTLGTFMASGFWAITCYDGRGASKSFLIEKLLEFWLHLRDSFTVQRTHISQKYPFITKPWELWSHLRDSFTVQRTHISQKYPFITKPLELWSRQLWSKLWSTWLAFRQHSLKQKRLGDSRRQLGLCRRKGGSLDLSPHNDTLDKDISKDLSPHDETLDKDISDDLSPHDETFDNSDISSDLPPHNETFDSDNVTLIAPYFYFTAGAWLCAGFDKASQAWTRLRSLEHLPEFCKPDLDLFKEYLVCITNGLLCMNVSKSTHDKFILVDLLTGKSKLLPPLNHRRNPVLLHLLVDASTHHFQVIVAGSNRAGDEHLSRITEVFDSSTWQWKRTGDLPGPNFALNEYQSGVHCDGSLYCIAFLDEEQGRGILRYNISKSTWLKNWTYPIPFATNSTILQLVESWGHLYLFSEQENERKIEHFVDKVELNDDANGGGTCRLKNVVRTKKMGGRSLEVYPEVTCMPYSDHQVCIFNTLDHSGVVYDVKNEGQSEELPAPPATDFGGVGFFSLNPMSFTVELSQKLP